MMRCRHYAGKPQQAQAVRAGHGAYLPGQRGRVVRGRMSADCGPTPTHSLGHHRSGTTRCSCSFAAMQTSLAIQGECRACYCSFFSADHVIAAGRQVCAGLSLAAGSHRSAGECVWMLYSTRTLSMPHTVGSAAGSRPSISCCLSSRQPSSYCRKGGHITTHRMT